jgi:VIT1/CCC1 family predicted Fe2+/Mn2+ transporter
VDASAHPGGQRRHLDVGRDLRGVRRRRRQLGRAGFRRVRGARGRDDGHGAVEYSKLRVEHDRQAAQLAAEQALIKTAPEAELDELTRLYVSRGLPLYLAKRVAVELTAHDALAAHAEAEYGITATTRIAPLRDTVAVSAAFAAGALLPWLAIVLIPGPARAPVTFAVVLAALALTGWVSARISHIRPVVPILRTASIGGLSMLITYLAGHFLYP